MPVRAGEAVTEPASETAVGPIEDLILARIAAQGGATRGEVARDLGPLVEHRLSPAEIRAAIEAGAGTLRRLGLATEVRGRFQPTDRGRTKALAFTEAGGTGLGAWEAVRDVTLVAKALGIGGEAAARKTALARPEGLRALILQKTYGLKSKKNIPDSKLRAQLALVALERAFGNKIKAGFAKGAGLPSKAARTLAGQLALAPRDFQTDARLIAQLAADSVGAAQTDPDALRLALLRRFVAALLDAAPVGHGVRPQTVQPLPSQRLVDTAANDATPRTKGPPPRPGLDEFSAAVRRAAGRAAQGWSGNRKAFISQVWDAIRVEHAIWALSEIEFKSMLVEAHRRGVIALANADLRNKDLRPEIERSATLDRNTVWHYVRIED